MIETPAAKDRQHRWLWRLTIRDRLVLISGAVLGLCFWIIERDWYWGALAAISLCIALGLAAQVHDLWRGSKGNGAWTSEERWGWRFAVAWRLVVMCLMVAYYLVRLLVKWKVLALDPGRDFIPQGVSGMHNAVLLTTMIVAIASSPRLTKRVSRRWWSWIAELLVGIAACILWAIILKDQLTIPALVHITIAGVEMAQPLQLSSEVLAAYDAKRLARFFDVTTAGVVSVLVSCVLLRLLSFCWWRGVRWRACLGVLLAASLATTIMLSGRIALVEVPDITPALAADIPMPRPHQWVVVAVLTLLLASAAARRWSEPPLLVDTIGNLNWRRDETRYYHERRILLLPLAGVMLIFLIHATLISWETLRCFTRGLSYCLAALTASPEVGLSAALIVLAVQGAFFGGRKCFDTALVYESPLAPGLFLLIWSALLAIIVFGVPILGAWGFALWFN
jgi:hypothetical protein